MPIFPLEPGDCGPVARVQVPLPRRQAAPRGPPGAGPDLNIQADSILENINCHRGPLVVLTTGAGAVHRVAIVIVEWRTTYDLQDLVTLGHKSWALGL
jgi:hypothetical protein